MKHRVLEEMRVLAGVHGDGIGAFFENPQAQQFREPMNEDTEALYRVTERGLYTYIRAVTKPLFDAYKLVGELRQGLDAIAYTDEDFKKSSRALRDGALGDLDDLIKTAGYALDRSFAEGHRYTLRRDDGFAPISYCGPMALTAFSLVGEVAEIKALAKEFIPKLRKGGSDLYDTDIDASIKALADFSAKAEGALDRVRTGISNLAAEIAKSST